MKSSNTKAIALALLLSSASSASANILESFQFCPYVGANLEERYQKWSQTGGENLFRKRVTQGNYYAGLRFWDYLGIEAGYETSVKGKQTTSLNSPDGFLGDSILVNPPEQHVSAWKVRGWHADLVGFLPVCDTGFEFIGSVGAAWLKVFHQDIQVSDSFGPFSSSGVQLTRNDFNKHRAVLRLGVGVQYMLCDFIGIRGIYNWEQTSRFKNIASAQRPANQLLRVNMKNSNIIGLGVFIGFF